ncbi:MAG TPA: helix-turn-helix transcriptional regulator [Steroidobacteraceae bacterium]|nr:helix-turn-helix transcriptional regulator [Steroidobacteraceae bacterium]
MATKAEKRELAGRIVKARDRIGITDAELARRLDVPRSQVHDWVHGIHQPNLSSLKQLAEVLDCEIAELLGAA